MIQAHPARAPKLVALARRVSRASRTSPTTKCAIISPPLVVFSLPESALKLHSDTNPGLNTVTAYGPDYIEVNRQRYNGAVTFGPEGEVRQWPTNSLDDLSADDLMGIAQVSKSVDPFALLDDAPPKRSPDQAEVVLVGTGSRQRFLPPSLVQPLLRAGVGVEVMDTQAAARTYNILMAEGRKVMVLLLPESA